MKYLQDKLQSKNTNIVHNDISNNNKNVIIIKNKPSVISNYQTYNNGNMTPAQFNPAKLEAKRRSQQMQNISYSNSTNNVLNSKEQNISSSEINEVQNSSIPRYSSKRSNISNNDNSNNDNNTVDNQHIKNNVFEKNPQILSTDDMLTANVGVDNVVDVDNGEDDNCLIM